MARPPAPEDDQVATLYQYPVITQCDLCKIEYDVQSFCRNCSQNLCDVCKRSHLRSTVSRDHNIVHISEGKSSQPADTVCAEHGLQLFYFCRTCSVSFCPRCLNPIHKDHEIMDLDKYAIEVQSKVSLMIEEKSKRVKENKQKVQHIEECKMKHTEACIKCRTSVKETAISLREEVDTVEKRLLSRINHHEVEGVSKFDQEKHRVKSKEEELQEALDNFVRHSKKHDNISLVADASKISEYVQDKVEIKETKLESHPETPSMLVPTIEFRKVRISDDSISRLFGTLKFHDGNGTENQLRSSQESEMIISSHFGKENATMPSIQEMNIRETSDLQGRWMSSTPELKTRENYPQKQEMVFQKKYTTFQDRVTRKKDSPKSEIENVRTPRVRSRRDTRDQYSRSPDMDAPKNYTSSPDMDTEKKYTTPSETREKNTPISEMNTYKEIKTMASKEMGILKTYSAKPRIKTSIEKYGAKITPRRLVKNPEPEKAKESELCSCQTNHDRISRFYNKCTQCGKPLK